MSEQPERKTVKADLILSPFSVLIGRWEMIAAHPMFPGKVKGQVSFEWLEEGALIVMRSTFEKPGPPSAMAVIGGDDSMETYSMLYFDERGVSRIYQVRIDDDIWKMWRDAPGFSQRFTGTISKDGHTISALWEKSSDGSQWERDLELVYSKEK